jgi:hypothetical protein
VRDLVFIPGAFQKKAFEIHQNRARLPSFHQDIALPSTISAKPSIKLGLICQDHASAVFVSEKPSSNAALVAFDYRRRRLSEATLLDQTTAQ